MKNIEPRRISRPYKPLVLITLMLMSVTLAAGSPPQGKVVLVGILPFQDETETHAPPELGKKLAAQLKQRLSVSFKDVLPKSLSPNADAALSTEQAVAIGKQSGVQFVVRGGVLSLTVDEQSNVSAQIYAEIISVESGKVTVVRGEGTGAGLESTSPLQWSSIDLNSPSYSSSAIGKAFNSAIESLLGPLHQAVMTPVAVNSSAEESGAPSESPSESVDTPAPAEAASADADEELQQLIAQAEEVVASGTGDETRLQSVSQALQKLKTALTSKASQIEGGADPTSTDQELASARNELQTALTALSEQAQTSSGAESGAESSAGGEEGEASSGEKKGLLGTIDKYAGEALGILQKIQEMRAAFRGATEEVAAESEQTEEAEQGAEQPTEDVSGVVMEMGKPLEGVEVVDQDSEVKAVTGPDGSYTLKGLPAGKLSTLLVQKGGKQLATGQVDVLRGRPGVADFDVKNKMAPGTTALRVIPSTVVLKNKSKGATGTIKGTARDKSGKVLTRALVRVPGVAVARTDSRGRYSFVGVPTGEYLLTISKPGLKPESTKVSVKANAATQAQTQLATDTQSRARSRERAIVRGSGTSLRGKVVGAGNKPLAGAKVMLLQSSSAVAVLTSKAGEYQLNDLRPGTYTALVSKLGFESSKRTVNAQVGRTESQNFQLKQKDSPYEAKLTNDRVRRTAQPRPVARKVDTVEKPTQSQRTDLMGRVFDATNRRAIAGAIVSTRGRTVRTGENGAFEIADLVPGNYLVKVSSTGFGEEERVIAVRAGASGREDFALKRMTTSGVPSRSRTEAPRATGQNELGQVRGRVVDAASGAPIPGAIVAVAGRSSVVTGRDGGFSIAALPTGTYQVIVRKTGFADRRGEFRIRGGETAAANFGLIPTVRKAVKSVK